MPASLPDFTAWPLSDVKAALAREPEWASLSLRLVETAPPQRRARGANGKEPQEQREARTAPGEWRVLRSRLDGSELELLVAREELRAAL